MLRATDVEPAIAAVLALLPGAPARTGPTRVIAVDGRSGAGKSSFARRLGAALDDAPVVRLDDVYPGWDGLEDGVTRLVDGVLRPVSMGDSATLRRYDWVTESDGEAYQIPCAATMVVEGCGAGAAVCRPFLSVLVWVQAPEDVRFRRAIDRDGESYRPHWRQWADQEDAHFAREGTAGQADVLLDTGTL
ncbi:uridine kinase family protein [Angustibacter luteus]|uniref:Uridine kinase n=1 Tax=Angustibacter luteus TaxID=658456 RepID=A0ABW1J9U0_9ACTN